MITHYLQYQYAVLVLLVTRQIDTATWWYAARNRPVVVCGPSGGIVVDAAFDMTPAQLARVSTVQFIGGSLMIAAGIALLSGLFGSAGWPGLKAVATVLGLLGGGIVLAVDATLAANRRWTVAPETVIGGNDAAHHS